VAQRLDLNYLSRAPQLLRARRRLTWALLIAAVLAGVPLVFGVGGSRKTLQNGPVSEAHAFFERRCEFCHTESFRTVYDDACGRCHDGAPQPAKCVDAGKASAQHACVDCHMEHRGRIRLAAVADTRCTECHSEITAHSTGAKVRNVSGFGE